MNFHTEVFYHRLVLRGVAEGQITNVDLRILARDTNLDLMDAHLTGASRSIPAVIALDSDYVERGWWGPRPAELQRWVLGEGKAFEKPERYKHIRGWYARDHALSTLEEVVSMLERAANSGTARSAAP